MRPAYQSVKWEQVDTPLLDRKEPLPSAQSKGRTARLLLGAAAGVALSWIGMRYGWFDAMGRVCVVFLPAFYLAILVHELGHLAAALAIGFRWREFAVGPVVLWREADRVRWHFVASRIVAGGQVQATPRSTEGLRRRFLILLVGGPVATALIFAVLPFLPRGPWTTAMGVANLLCALTSWLPYYMGGYVTDAKAIVLLRHGGPEGDGLAALLYILASDSQGVPPRDWDAVKLGQLEAAADAPLAATAAVLMLAYTLDGRDPDAIVAATERALARAATAIPLHRRMILETAAYVQGIYRRDAVLAAEWLADARKVKGVASEQDWDADSMGAIALANGAVEEARDHFRRALARLDRQPPGSGAVAASRARLEGLIAICGQAASG
jgi:hypothetical protein